MSRREVIATLRLFLACSTGDIAGVESALRLKASPNARSEEGLTPILATVWAWAGAPIPVIRKLVEAGADLNLARPECGSTALHIAVIRENLPAIKYIASEPGCDANATDANGHTALQAATWKGNSEAIEALVRYGNADIHAGNTESTPLTIAARLGPARHNAIDTLVALGADVNMPCARGATPVFTAARYGNHETVEVLAKFGADVSLADVEGAGPCYVAAQNGYDETIRTLHRLGADVDAQMRNGASPLFIAARFAHCSTIRVLVELGASANQAMHDGRTPLTVAADQGHAQTVETLVVSCGADANYSHPFIGTAIICAAAKGHAHVIRSLAASGADVNTVCGSREKTTAMFLALSNGYVDACKALLLTGAVLAFPESLHRRIEKRGPLLTRIGEVKGQLAAWAKVELDRGRWFDLVLATLACSAVGGVVADVLGPALARLLGITDGVERERLVRCEIALHGEALAARSAMV